MYYAFPPFAYFCFGMQETLLTDRLFLRQVSGPDLAFIHELLSLPEIDRYNTQGIPANIEETKTILDNWLLNANNTELRLYPFLITLNNTNHPVGLISMRVGHPKYRRAEISYKIHSSQWQNGYASEAVKRIIEFGFTELGLHRIHAGCAVDNLASIRVLEKAGMQREGRMRQILPLSNGWSDNFEYAILETDPR